MPGMRVLIAAVTVLAVPCDAAQLTPETSRAFDHYAEVADKNPVLPAEAVRAAHRGETIVSEKKVPFVAVPGGLVHDWFGVLFIPGATLASVRAVMQDYDNYKRIYRPERHRVEATLPRWQPFSRLPTSRKTRVPDLDL